VANQLANTPWKIDTPGAGILYSGWMKIAQFEFIYVAQGDTVTVTDSLGNLVYNATGVTDGETQRSGKIGNILGLIVPTLTGGGSLLVYVQ